MFGRNSLPDNLPRLRNYAEALARYESTVPLRTGNDKGLVPLGDNRRYKRSQMVKGETRHGIAYINCQYWQKDVIRFYQDGKVEFDVGHWHTPTTLMFLNDVFGRRFTRKKGKIYYIKHELFYYLDPVNGLQLNEAGEPIDPVPEIAKTLNRAKWKELTNKVKAFSTYAQDMMKIIEPKPAGEVVDEFNALLRNYGEEYWRPLCSEIGKPNAKVPYLTIMPREIKYNRGKITQVRKAFIERVIEASQTGDPDKMYPLMFVLQTSASVQKWTGNGYCTECSPALIKKHLMELLKFEFCEELFDDVAQPLGGTVADSNARYFTKQIYGIR